MTLLYFCWKCFYFCQCLILFFVLCFLYWIIIVVVLKQLKPNNVYNTTCVGVLYYAFCWSCNLFSTHIFWFLFLFVVIISGRMWHTLHRCYCIAALHDQWCFVFDDNFKIKRKVRISIDKKKLLFCKIFNWFNLSFEFMYNAQ